MQHEPVEMDVDELYEKEFGPEATFRKHNALYRVVQNMRVKDKRQLFRWMRTEDDVSEDTFFPGYGMTAGEFTTHNVLSDKSRKNTPN
jgi:hypothetical protein